jgi:uncharacterized protein (DUF58 family)
MRRIKELRPSEVWTLQALLLMAAGFVLGAPGLMALVGILVPIVVIAWVWNRLSLRSIRYHRRFHYRRAFPDEVVDAEVSVENHKLIPLSWLRLADHWPIAVGPQDETMIEPGYSPGEGQINMVFLMRGYARTRRSLALEFRERGVYKIGPALATSGDPLGLFHSEKLLEGEDRVVVFPEVRPVQELGLRADDPFGKRPSPQQLFQDNNQPVGVRDYRPEDSFRRIHWPATARVGRLQSRVYQPVSGHDLILCLNVTTLAHHWMGGWQGLLEELVRTAASLVSRAVEEGYRVGLVSNGSIAQGGQPFRIMPGRSRQHLPHLLEALAGLTPFVTTPFDRYLMRQAPHLQYGSTLIVLTAVTPPALIEVLLRLKERTRRSLLISLAEEAPPFMPGVQTIHRPFRADEAQQ